jgi:DNA polymerase V
MYALVDCNNFYASCEQVFQPRLQNQPVVVLSNNDGCIIARSKEAKALGFQMGEPAFQAEARLRRHHVHVFSSNYTLYGDMSQRVMERLQGWAPSVEVYSIDEAFLDLRGMETHYAPEALTRNIRADILRSLGLPVGIGLGPTKTLAKVANWYAKKVPGNQGVCFLREPQTIRDALRGFDLDEVWGIGRQYAALLQRQGVADALDFTRLPDAWVRKHMTVFGLRTKWELQGTPCIPMELIPASKKGICTSRSFGRELTRRDEVEQAIAYFATRCAEKLRAQRSVTQLMTVFLRTNPFKPGAPQYCPTRCVSLPTPSQSTVTLTRAAVEATRRMFRHGYPYKKGGIVVTEIVPESPIQGDLFASADDPRHQAAMQAMDRVNRKFGRDTVRTATYAYGRKWRLRCEHRSPCYTTRWQDVIQVQA